MAGEKILIVEDERIVARDIEKRLTKLGYLVAASVASGEEALAMIANLQPDLVLMDIQLRGKMDGIATAEQLRADFDIPVVYLTAYADEATLQRAKATEPFGYIVKPFDERELHVAIEIALRRRLAEAAIRVALEKERELSELKSRFWSMVIHEFRNPLTTILSAAQLIETSGEQLPEERKREYLYLIQNSVRLMDELLKDTLAIARTDQNDLVFNPQPLDLESFCLDLVEEFQFSVGHSHQIRFQCEGNCTDVYLDRKLLWHILSNLLTNSIKYSPTGGTVDLDVTCLGGEVIFKVKDTGIGIPQTDQKRLFEPFHRAENVGNIQGTGLGLTLVKRCLERHHGHITVDSLVGRGTTFTIHLYAMCPITQKC